MQATKVREFGVLLLEILKSRKIRGQVWEMVKILLNVAGMLIFAALTYVFYFMLAFFCVIAGFVRANRRGSR